MIAWILFVIFAIISIVLLLGKGGFLIAGYNTSNKEEKAQYNEKRLCRIMGGCMSCVSIVMLINAVYAYDVPGILQWTMPWGIILPVIVALILSNTMAKENPDTISLKKNKGVWLVTIGVVIIGIVVSFVLYTGDVSIKFGKETLVIDASFVSEKSISYEEIQEVRYVENYDIGKRNSGVGSFTIQAGKYRNKELGRYRLYSYTDCKDYVIIVADSGILVINDKTEQATEDLYQHILSEV